MPLHNDLLLLLGPGHMELNEAGILLKLLWHPLISQLASMVGFRTPRAKDVVREGIDHHRTRQILSVCLEALSKELVLPFVHECIRNEEEVSVEGYRKYFKNVQNQSYIFFYDIAFSYLLSFHLLTEAIRKNNSRRILAARIQFAPLFYSFHHPKYQQLHLRDIWQRAQMPEPLLEFVNSNESFSLSGKNNTGQGCDFLHEELNKKIKSLLPPVMPTNEVWTRVCRKLKDLEEIRDSTVKPTATTKAFKKFANEITLLRQKLRENGFNLNPCIYGDMRSIDGNELDEDLVDLKYTAEENYKLFQENFFETGKCNVKISKPVFVTKTEREEFQKIENKTKFYIKQEITKILHEMPDKEAAA